MAFTYCTNCGEKIDDSVERCPHCNHPKGADRVYVYGSESFGKKDSTEGQGVQKNPWENNQNKGEQGGNSFENQNSGSGQNNQNENPYEGGSGQNQNPYGNGQGPYGQNGNQWGQNPYGQRNPWEGGQGGWNNGPYGGDPYNNNGPYGQNFGGGYQPWQPRERKKLSVGLVIFSVINILLGTCCAGSIFGIIGLIFAVTARDAASEAEELRRKKISLAINIIAVVLTVIFMISFAVGFFQGGGFQALLQQ